MTTDFELFACFFFGKKREGNQSIESAHHSFSCPFEWKRLRSANFFFHSIVSQIDFFFIHLILFTHATDTDHNYHIIIIIFMTVMRVWDTRQIRFPFNLNTDCSIDRLALYSFYRCFRIAIAWLRVAVVWLTLHSFHSIHQSYVFK